MKTDRTDKRVDVPKRRRLCGRGDSLFVSPGLFEGIRDVWCRSCWRKASGRNRKRPRREL